MQTNFPQGWYESLDDVLLPQHEAIKMHMVDNTQATVRIGNGARLLKTWTKLFKQLNHHDGSGQGVLFGHELVLRMDKEEKECTLYVDVCTHMRKILADFPAIANIPLRKAAANKLIQANRNYKWGKGIHEALLAVAQAQTKITTLEKPKTADDAKEKPAKETVEA